MKKEKLKKLHRQKYFYKYLTFDGAYEMLLSKKFRYSAPRLFNDPFDFQFDVMRHHRGSADEMRKIIEVAYSDVYENKSATKYSDNFMYRVFRELIIKKKNQVKNDKTILSDFLEDMDFLGLVSERLNRAIRIAIESQFVFCVSENENHPLMWSHYSDGHRGAVIRIKSNAQAILKNAKKVRYSHQIPSTNLTEISDDGQKLLKSLYEILCTKGKCWSYEKEWRHVVNQKEYKGAKFFFKEYDPSEISAIYFGCKISEENKNLLFKHVRQHMPHVELYQAEKNDSSFTIESKKIDLSG